MNGTTPNQTATSGSSSAASKKQMRFQCRFCIYKSHSVSLMQNHIYRHIDTTPYSCFYCGHKSTTKSTIMVHIELCHPNMEVKIKESRVKEEDYYLDLNSANNNNNSHNSSSTSSHQSNLTNANNNYMHTNSKTTFEIIPNKCHQEQHQQQQQLNNNLRKRKIETRFDEADNNPASDSNKSSVIATSVLSYNKPTTTTTTTSVSSSSSSASISSSASSICSSPAHSPQPLKNQSTAASARSGSSPDMAPVSESIKTSTSEHETSGTTAAAEPFINIANQSVEDEDNNKDGNNYVTVFNRPKQYFGSLYEPDKQYSCKLCTYTTNHKPSMEDHVYVHTNKRPYR